MISLCLLQCPREETMRVQGKMDLVFCSRRLQPAEFLERWSLLPEPFAA